MLLPVTPSEITRTIGNRNETVDLINIGEINIPKAAGLLEFKFSFVLPSQKYPFANYWIPAQTFIEYLEKLKKDKKPFQFIITRMNLQTVSSFTNKTVVIENYSIEESADNGLDFVVDITLKEYVEYGTKLLEVKDGVAKFVSR